MKCKKALSININETKLLEKTQTLFFVSDLCVCDVYVC